MTGRVLAVVGGQYGSEGKGNVVNFLANQYDVHVRTGAPNAGHSFWHDGRKWVMQSIPCGWTNSDAKLVIGRGALINPEILVKEISMLVEGGYDICKRLYIDPMAGVLDPAYHKEEGGVDGEMHRRIGSTGEGVGIARVRRIERDPNRFKFMGEVAREYNLEQFLVEDTPDLLASLRLEGKDILLEGTQGSGLSLIHGPWPYCTSNDTNAAQMAADAGIPPHYVTAVMLVARTFPIRVAGNSGPLSFELSWAEMSDEVGRPLEERTTVTKKIRRVGRWDWDLINRAITLNGPTSVALTFMDYAFPDDMNKTKWDSLSFEGQNYIRDLEDGMGVPIRLIATSDSTMVVR